jgi:hypothetical protein
MITSKCPFADFDGPQVRNAIHKKRDCEWDKWDAEKQVIPISVPVPSCGGIIPRGYTTAAQQVPD